MEYYRYKAKRNYLLVLRLSLLSTKKIMDEIPQQQIIPSDSYYKITRAENRTVANTIRSNLTQKVMIIKYYRVILIFQ